MLSVVAALFFSVGANVSKVVLHAGVEPKRLTALRCTGAAVALLVVIVATRPALLRIQRQDIGRMIVLGLTGAALVQFLFFTALDRLPVGIALLLEFTAPFLIAGYQQIVRREPPDLRTWLSIALGLSGLALVAKVWTNTGLDPVGVAAGLGAAACLATFFIVGKTSLERHHPLTMSFWMFVVAAVFWAVAAPWWNFDTSVLTTRAPLLGALDAFSLPIWIPVVVVIVVGTLVAYLLEIASLQHLTPTAKGVVGMCEPLIAAAIAWAWLDQALDGIQLLGGLVTLAAIVAIQTRRTTPLAM